MRQLQAALNKLVFKWTADLRRGGSWRSWSCCSGRGGCADYTATRYAALDQDKLRDFLETASFYSLPKAIAVCEGAKPAPLYREVVFILGRMGGSQNTQRALGITSSNLP